MKNKSESIKDFYLTDEYILKNPSLHEEDSPWKISKILPLIDKSLSFINKKEINLLDVGGGAGLILKAVSNHIEKAHGVKVNKFALDLSPGMLKIQKKQNLNLKKALNEDICKTSLGNKEICLTLMIDILEHVPNPVEALEEVKRISDFTILKVPLENNLHFRALNFIKKGSLRKSYIENIGHINAYSFRKLKNQIEKHAGRVLNFYFTNVFDYNLSSEQYRNKMSTKNKLIKSFAALVFKLSPCLCSLVFDDFVMMLVKCD